MEVERKIHKPWSTLPTTLVVYSTNHKLMTMVSGYNKVHFKSSVNVYTLGDKRSFSSDRTVQKKFLVDILFANSSQGPKISLEPFVKVKTEKLPYRDKAVKADSVHNRTQDRNWKTLNDILSFLARK